METLTFIHEDGEKKGAMIAMEGSVKAGEMTYIWSGPDKFIIDHTDVNPDFGGRGVGKQILHRLVAFARERQVKILPLCPFAKSVFDKDKTIADVLF